MKKFVTLKTEIYYNECTLFIYLFFKDLIMWKYSILLNTYKYIYFDAFKIH